MPYMLVNVYMVINMERTIKLALASLLESKGITRYELSKRTNIQYQTIDRYYKNKVIKYDSYILQKICLALDCEVGDIIKII